MKLRIAFDVDGTLIELDGVPGKTAEAPRYDVIKMMDTFHNLKTATIFIWSGGGCNLSRTFCLNP